ncbi:hypothetical protein YC2023_002284 [Brassica napus]
MDASQNYVCCNNISGQGTVCLCTQHFQLLHVLDSLSLSSSPPGFHIPRNFLDKAENTKHKGCGLSAELSLIKVHR